MKFKECLKRARENANLTQRQLAEKLNVPASMIGRYESSDTEPRIDLVKRICDVLNISPNTLLDYESSNEEYFCYLLRQCNIDIKQGEFIENTLKYAITGKGNTVKGYILTHIETGELLKIKKEDFQKLIDRVLENTRKQSKTVFFNAFKKEMNYEFFCSYAYYSQEDVFNSILTEIEEVKKTGDLKSITQIEKKLEYLQALYKKIYISEEFRKKLDLGY